LSLSDIAANHAFMIHDSKVGPGAQAGRTSIPALGMTDGQKPAPVGFSRSAFSSQRG
jgi:hypothetical protein